MTGASVGDVWARSTWANFDLGHRLFPLGPVLLGQVRLRPGQKLEGKVLFSQVQLRPILACPFDHPNCQDKKKKEKKEGKRNERAGQSMQSVFL